MFKFSIQPYSRLDKGISVLGPVDFEIEADDAPTDQVAILAEHLVACLNLYWQDPTAFRCENEGCDNFWVARTEPTGDCPECGSLLRPFTVSL